MRSRLLDNGVHFLNTHCHDVVSSVINAYSTHANLHNMELKVKFVMERGIDGGGLRRELCNCFWTEYSGTSINDHLRIATTRYITAKSSGPD